jgi:hypothetical protein
MQKQKQGKPPKQLHWHTAWKCLAESLTMAFFAIFSTTDIGDTALPLYTRLFSVLGAICLWLLVLGWLYDLTQVLRDGPQLSRVAGFLSSRPFVHLIASLILLPASLWIGYVLCTVGYLPSALPVLLQLLTCWLINIFCWLHVAALRKLGPATLPPEKERWWVDDGTEKGKQAFDHE